MQSDFDPPGRSRFDSLHKSTKLAHTRLVPVTSAQKGRLQGGQPSANDHQTSPHLNRSLEEGIAKSQSFLLGEVKPEGFWVGELMVDSTLVSDTIAYHHWNGKVDLEWQRKAVNHIFSMQLWDVWIDCEPVL